MRRLVDANVACNGSVMGDDLRATGARPRQRVLIVDDFEDNRFLYATYFSHVGFHAEEASDGEEALMKIAGGAFDAVVMDLSMPKLDGWETTRRIKSNPDSSHVFVIVVTGNTTEANVAAAYAAGADEVRTKPCVLRELVELVREHLGERRVETVQPSGIRNR